MTDIDFGAGVGSWLGTWVTIALGLLGTFVGLVLALRASDGESPNRAIAYCAGPLVCVGAGWVFHALVSSYPLHLDADWLIFGWPTAGIAIWIAVALVSRRRTAAGLRLGGEPDQRHHQGRRDR